MAKPAKKETQVGSFLFSEKSAEAPKLAEVIAINEHNEVTYKIGDVIIYKPYAMTEVQLNGEEYYLIELIDVIGRLTNDNN